MVAQPTLVSLFSGAGGLDVGLERAGWRTVSATDSNRDAMATLGASQQAGLQVAGQLGAVHLHAAKLITADVVELSAADLRPTGARRTWRPSLLAGGPPCQPWSSAGLQKGFNDPRGLMIAQMIRLTDELKPRFVLMENVRGLLTAGGPNGVHGEAIRIIQQEWENLGYAVVWGLLNAADFGAAQRRVRLLMIATSDHELPSMPEPTHSKSPSAAQKPWVTLGEFLSHQPAPNPSDIVIPSGLREPELRELRPGTGLRTGGKVEHQRPGGHWGYRQDSFVADPSLPSRTIRAAATPDWLKFPDGYMRRLTWRECAALQGFPGGWQFCGTRESRFRQIGNAVQADMAEALGGELLAALKRGLSSEVPVSAAWPEYFDRRIRGASADHRANAASRTRRSHREAS
jgi:DNA (cytosine-5)-methyltransferase 1